MNHPDEGYIKFNCHWEKMPLENNELINELIHYRQILFSKKLIGVLDDGIGYGNISMRIPGTETFIITGSATGSEAFITSDHISLVIKSDLKKNYIECRGNAKASSESLTHAAIYMSDFKINAVVHTHHKGLWQKYFGILPTTPADAAYGTTEMADGIVKLMEKPDRKDFVIIMGGHEDGILTFGKNLKDACEELFNLPL